MTTVALAGAVLAFLGAAAIAVPNDPGSRGTLGGGLAIVVGLAIAATTAYEWRRQGEPVSRMTNHMVPTAGSFGIAGPTNMRGRLGAAGGSITVESALSRRTKLSGNGTDGD